MSIETVVTKLHNRIANSEIGEYFEEDDLKLIAKEAIQRAFFERKSGSNKSNYGFSSGTSSGLISENPPIVDMAKSAFNTRMATKVDEIVEDLCSTPEFSQMISQTIIAMLPGILMSGMREHIITSIVHGLTTTSWDVSEAITKIVEERLHVQRK